MTKTGKAWKMDKRGFVDVIALGGFIAVLAAITIGTVLTNSIQPAQEKTPIVKYVGNNLEHKYYGLAIPDANLTAHVRKCRASLKK